MSAAPAIRLTSLDQFRGYTMLGMLLVNFLGSYVVCPRILRHTHDYCSYADTIMPHFVFAAGFAMRLSFHRRQVKGGQIPWGRATRRILGLAAIAIGWYTLADLSEVLKFLQTKSLDQTLFVLMKRTWFQTLLHIAATSLWILPVVLAPFSVRLFYGLGSLVLHGILSYWFYIEWVNTLPNGIDGGPLGFLTWSTPALLGTWVYDVVHSQQTGAFRKLVVVGTAIMAVAWGFSCLTTLYDRPSTAVAASVTPEVKAPPRNARKLAPDPVIPDRERWEHWSGRLAEPPFVPPPPANKRSWNYWMMSQRCGTPTYLLFSGGLSLVIYALFLLACDGWGWQSGLLRTLGTNSLAAYILHDVAGLIVKPWFPRDSSPGMVLLALSLFFLLTYIPCRLLERKGWYLRV